MLEIFKSTENSLVQTTFIDKGVWINLENPNETEIRTVCSALDVDDDFIRAALDDEESARIETDDDHHLIVIDIPYSEVEDQKVTYETIPLAVIYNDDCIVTVCLQESSIIRQFAEGKVKSFYTQKKMRFILLLLYRISVKYLVFLKQINKMAENLEKKVSQSTRNKELFQLLELQKSLVYFNTSLHGNAKVLDKLMRAESIARYPEDADLLEDVITENRQAIEMTNIYTDIMANTVNAFANVINNNMNTIMKNLTLATILMGIFTVISGLFGMNVPVPFHDNPFAFPVIAVCSFTLAATVFYALKRKRWF